jgi:hypothetical protein
VKRRAPGRLQVAWLTLLTASSCAYLPVGPREIRNCPGPLVPTQEIEGDFAIQQRWRVIAGEIDFPLQGLLEKRGDELVLIGLNAFGAKLFTLVQRGTDVEVQAAPPAILPVPPLNLLRDLHRMLFLAAEAPPTGNGEVTRLRPPDRIFESWRDGQLQRRDFLRDRGASVRLEFSGEAKRPHVRLTNPGCGYRIEIDTISEQPLVSVQSSPLRTLALRQATSGTGH